MMLAQPSIAEKLMVLFPTSTRCHGTYNPDPKTFVMRKRDCKIVPVYRTVLGPVTLDIWERHLAGSYPLVAALACDDGTTKVSVVDIDVYTSSCIRIAETIKRLGLPLYVRKSKSSGAHIYAFHAVPISIAESVRVSRGIAPLLGYPDDAESIEYFPRVQKPDVEPRCLNMPYLGDGGFDNSSGGFAGFINVTGGHIAVEDFLSHVCFLTDEQRSTIVKTKEPRKAQPTEVDVGRKYAQGKLRRYENELRNATSEGNNLLTKHAFHMGTMVPNGWIDRDEIIRTFRAAIAHWDQLSKHHETLDRSISDGEKHPHSDLLIENASLEDFYAYLPQHKYIYVPTRELWPAASIDAVIPSVDKKLKASTWLDQNRAVEQMTWSPGGGTLIRGRLVADGGWFDKPGASCFNLYKPPIFEPGDASKAGPWLDLVQKVYPSDAEHIVTWCAHRVQQPGVKINHGLLMVGAPGIGKDTILEPVKYGVGPWNWHEVSPQHLLGRFNGFLKSVILRVNEARDLGEMNRYAFYEHMKTMLASPPDVLLVDEKNLREHQVFNCVSIAITSNYLTGGIYLPADDRRHYVALSSLTNADFDEGYWTQLWQWYAQEGIRHVTAYLSEYDISGFDPKAPPPKTAAFWES